MSSMPAIAQQKRGTTTASIVVDNAVCNCPHFARARSQYSSHNTEDQEIRHLHPPYTVLLSHTPLRFGKLSIQRRRKKFVYPTNSYPIPLLSTQKFAHNLGNSFLNSSIKNLPYFFANQMWLAGKYSRVKQRHHVFFF
jgi:hypothetical protein